MLYLTNAFSLQMLRSSEAQINTTPVSGIKAYEMWAAADSKICAIGHADLAAVAADVLVDPGVVANRANVCLEEDDVLLVAQLMSGRSSEGATTLPKGFEIEWIVVKALYFTW